MVRGGTRAPRKGLLDPREVPATQTLESRQPGESARPRSTLPLESAEDMGECLCAYPACIRIKEPPPHPIRYYGLHSTATVQKHGQHTFPQINDLLVLLRVGRVGGIVRHGMFLRNRWDDQCGVQTGERITKRGEL